MTTTTQETRDARKRTRTLRTLFAAIEQAVQDHTDLDMLGLTGVDVFKTSGGYDVAVAASPRGVKMLFAWGPEGTLEMIQAGPTQEED